jgi:hypothetical protein
MLKTSLVAMFLLSMATLTISASSLPVPSEAQSVVADPAIDVAELE